MNFISFPTNAKLYKLAAWLIRSTESIMVYFCCSLPNWPIWLKVASTSILANRQTADQQCIRWMGLKSDRDLFVDFYLLSKNVEPLVKVFHSCTASSFSHDKEQTYVFTFLVHRVSRFKCHYVNSHCVYFFLTSQHYVQLLVKNSGTQYSIISNSKAISCALHLIHFTMCSNDVYLRTYGRFFSK